MLLNIDDGLVLPIDILDSRVLNALVYYHVLVFKLECLSGPTNANHRGQNPDSIVFVLYLGCFLE